MTRKDKVDKLFHENKKLVYDVVNKRFDAYNEKYKELGIEREDLYQMGFIGLFKAAKKFDEKRNLKFSTYAFPLIYGEIQNTLRYDANINIPREALAIALKIKKDDTINFGKITVKEIMEKHEITEYIAKAVRFALDVQYISAEKVVTDSGGNADLTLKETLSSDYNLEEDVESNVLLKEKLSMLDEREKKIVLLTAEGLKQREVANIIGIKQPHVCRIYKDAIKKMQEGELINV